MIVSLALSLIAIASGYVLTYAYEEDEPLASRLCAGACVGFALLGLIGFALALGFGLHGITLALTALITASPLFLLVRTSFRSRVNTNVNEAISAIGRATQRPTRWHFIYFLFYAAIAICMWLIFQRAMLEQDDAVYTGVLNNYGDLPFHLSVITRFAYGQNFPPEDPTFAGVRFTYPFITDFISAMFVRAGASLRSAMFIENYIVAVALVGVVHRFGQRLVRNRVAAIVTPLLILLNGGLGWTMLWADVQGIEGGVFQVLRRMSHSYTILPDIEKAWRWGNSITSLLVTQRGFLLGIPLAVIVFGLWWASLNDEGEKEKGQKGNGEKGKAAKRQRDSARGSSVTASSPLTPSPFPLFPLSPSAKRMLAAGVITGLLPLIHAHSFLSIMLVATFLVPWVYRRAWLAYASAVLLGGITFFAAASYEVANSTPTKVILAIVVLGLIASLWFLLPRQHLRLWVCFFVMALVVGLPQIFWSTRGTAVRTQSFLAWQFGWDSNEQEMFGSKPVDDQPIETVPPVRKWIQRAPYVAWFWLKNTGFFIPLLLIALVWKPDEYLAPRRLLLFYLPFTLCFIVPNFVKLAPWVWDNIKMLFYWWIASAPIVALLLSRLWEQHVGHKVMAASLFVLLTLAGALDIVPLLARQGEYEEFDRNGVAFAESIKQGTPHDATILHAPIHNTPIFLTGRRSVMGYPGHIWTHGIDSGPVENDIKRIYSGGFDAPALLTKYRVDYVVIGPQEHHVVKPNVAFFERFPIVVRIPPTEGFGEYLLYKVTP